MEYVYFENGETMESPFAKDNFSSRRTTGHNLYDPESLLTGKEIKAGFSYLDPRVWPTKMVYTLAINGRISPEGIAIIAPRQRLSSSGTFINLLAA